MSKNIVIQEGGQGKQMTANKLKTNLVGGGTCLWVPEDETMLGTKVITENGTYKASDDGYYGYSKVTVSGIGTATGTGPDGETHSYTEDGDGGVIDMVLPDIIAVDVPPTKTAYADGETIDFTGIVVKAFLKSGEPWTDSSHPDGIIPISELVFPVTSADASQVEGQTASSDLPTDPASPLKTASGLTFTQKAGTGDRAYTYTYSYSGGMAVCVQATDNPTYLRIVIANESKSDITEHVVGVSDVTGEIFEDRTNIKPTNGIYTHDGKTVYHYSMSIGMPGTVAVISPSPEHLNSSRPVTFDEIAWTILYGTISGGVQLIPVQWTRPGDFKTLEGHFGITVN